MTTRHDRQRYGRGVALDALIGAVIVLAVLYAVSIAATHAASAFANATTSQSAATSATATPPYPSFPAVITNTSTGIAATGTVINGAPRTSAPLALPLPHKKPAPLVLAVGADGHALVRGTITSVNADSVVIRTWGGTWTVLVTQDTFLAPSPIASMRVGDFAGASGLMAEADGPNTIKASVLRDWTIRPYQQSAAANSGGGSGTTTATSTESGMSSSSSPQSTTPPANNGRRSLY